MVFQKGNDPNRGPGRVPGQKTKRTQIIDGLKLVYGKHALTVFIAQLAQQARGVTKAEADALSLEGKFTDPQLPCRVSQKLLLDRLVAPLKPIEVLPGGEGGIQLTIARFTPEVDKLPESTSTVKDVTPALKAEIDQEVTGE